MFVGMLRLQTKQTIVSLALNKQVKVLSRHRVSGRAGTKTFSEQLTQAGIKNHV